MPVEAIGWGFFKGIYDSNIFASAFDIVPSDVRGVVSGSMNCAGWLVGAGIAPVLIGFLAGFMPLGEAIASSAVVYWVAAALLLMVMAFSLDRDIERLRQGQGGMHFGSLSS